MNQTLPSDHPALVGMVNPFTRLPMKALVSIVAAPGHNPYSRFFVSMDSTASPQSGCFDSVEELLTLLRTREGVINLIPEEQALFCPYTGSPLRIVPGMIPNTFCVTGGWDPCVPVESADELAYYAFMRGGVPNPKYPKPQARVAELPRKITRVTEQTAPDTSVEISQTVVNKDAVAMSEGTVEGMRKAAGVSGAVSMGGMGLPGKFIPPGNKSVVTPPASTKPPAQNLTPPPKRKPTLKKRKPTPKPAK